jgi:hypothetical protein
MRSRVLVKNLIFRTTGLLDFAQRPEFYKTEEYNVSETESVSVLR